MLRREFYSPRHATVSYLEDKHLTPEVMSPTTLYPMSLSYLTIGELCEALGLR